MRVNTKPLKTFEPNKLLRGSIFEILVKFKLFTHLMIRTLKLSNYIEARVKPRDIRTLNMSDVIRTIYNYSECRTL